VRASRHSRGARHAGVARARARAAARRRRRGQAHGLRRRGGCAPTSVFWLADGAPARRGEASDAPVEVNRRDASVKVKRPDASVGVNRRDAWVKVKRPDASRRGPLAAGAKTQPVKIICTCGTSYRAFLKSLTFQECPVGSYLSTAMCPTSYIASHLCVAPRAAAAGAAYPARAAAAGAAYPARAARRGGRPRVACGSARHIGGCGG